MSTSSFASTTASTFGTVLPTGTVSALIGNPPNTTKDYFIAKFILLALGKNTDPSLGAFIPPARPADYVFQTRGPKIIVSMSIAIAVMITITGLRLGVRVLRRGLMVGWDDVFIVPGVVSFFFAVPLFFNDRFTLVCLCLLTIASFWL